MAETRDPARGSWTVFEGDTVKTHKEAALPWGGDVNEAIEWPITLRVLRIRDGVAESVDVEIDEAFAVTFEHESVRIR